MKPWRKSRGGPPEMDKNKCLIFFLSIRNLQKRWGHSIFELGGVGGRPGDCISRFYNYALN